MVITISNFRIRGLAKVLGVLWALSVCALAQDRGSLSGRVTDTLIL